AAAELVAGASSTLNQSAAAVALRAAVEAELRARLRDAGASAAVGVAAVEGAAADPAVDLAFAAIHYVDGGGRVVAAASGADNRDGNPKKEDDSNKTHDTPSQ